VLQGDYLICDASLLSFPTALIQFFSLLGNSYLLLPPQLVGLLGMTA